MKIAITDACIFIDLYELELSTEFFSLPLEIHTSLDVFNELFPQQQQVLKAFQSLGKLSVHNITMEDRMRIFSVTYPKGLSDNDKTVLYLAEKLQAIVLSSDKTVRNYAKRASIEYQGMLWIFDSLLESAAIKHADACAKLNKLILTNIVYQNNTELLSEMNRRLKLWANK
jgi:hypothetical protein